MVMVQMGYETTNPVTMDEMLMLSKSVRRGAPDTFIIGDMPQGSYEISNEDAIRNALRFIKEAGCDAVKLEGGKRMSSRVRAIADAGILVIGHFGLTPQSTGAFGGYRVQGKQEHPLKLYYQTRRHYKKLAAGLYYLKSYSFKTGRTSCRAIIYSNLWCRCRYRC